MSADQLRRDAREETIKATIEAYLDQLLDLEHIDTDDLAENIAAALERKGDKA